MRATTQGTLLALTGAILFGLVNVAARASTLPPLVLGSYAYLLAGGILAITLRRTRIDKRDWPKILTMSVVGGALAPALLFFGLQQATAADASILLTIEMVFTAILAAIFLRERARIRAWIGIGLLFASTIVIAIVTSAREGVTTLLGAALVCLAAFGWGIDNTVSTKLVGSYKPHQLIAIKGLLGGSVALLVAIVLGNNLLGTMEDIRAVLYIGILGVGASILLFYHALQRIGATLTSGLFLPTTAIAGVLGGGILLGEDLTLAHAAAGTLALAGVLLVSTAPAPRTPVSQNEGEPDA